MILPEEVGDHLLLSELILTLTLQCTLETTVAKTYIFCMTSYSSEFRDSMWSFGSCWNF